MRLDKIKDFRIGCSRKTALVHLEEEGLRDALNKGSIEEVDGFYYAVMGRFGIQPYVKAGSRPLRWNLSCQWALPGYVPKAKG